MTGGIHFCDFFHDRRNTVVDAAWPSLRQLDEKGKGNMGKMGKMGYTLQMAILMGYPLVN
jgi:hypothetical protein